jgi:small conductance mechanosensitive channel
MFNFVSTAYAQEIAMEGQNDTVLNVLLAILGFMRNLFIAGLLLIASFIFARILSHYIIGKLRATQGETLHEDVVILVRRMVSVFVIAVGMGIAFQYVLGLDVLQIIGFFGLGLGFAFKDILSNLLAGVIVLMQGRFHIGDLIKIGQFMGKVVEIQTRATILRAIDGTEIIIPNADFLSKTVTSFTTNPTRRIQLIVGVHYKTDIDVAVKIIESVLMKNKNILQKPRPRVIATEFGESAITLSIRFWAQSKDAVCWIYTRSKVINDIRKAFEQQGITIPFPIRTVHRGTEADGLGWQQPAVTGAALATAPEMVVAEETPPVRDLEIEEELE